VVGARKLLIHFQFPVEWVNTNSFMFLFKKSRVAKIICNSYFTKQFIDKKFGVNSFLLYPPATTATENKQKKDNVILTVGRFSLLKNGTDFKKLGVMVKSFKKFQKKRLKGWKMIIVTSVRPDLENSYKEFVDSIKSSHIEVHKNASFAETEEMYSKAKIYWHAAGFGEDLVRHPERAEHFGISTVEAMSHGCVPVVINAGGQKEIVNEGDNGFLWDTEEELIEKTHRIAVDKDLFMEVAERAVESSLRFSNDRFSEELNHLIW
jgi:glycosyltransferase involved in cell wall biosynthesis